MYKQQLANSQTKKRQLGQEDGLKTANKRLKIDTENYVKITNLEEENPNPYITLNSANFLLNETQTYPEIPPTHHPQETFLTEAEKRLHFENEKRKANNLARKQEEERERKNEERRKRDAEKRMRASQDPLVIQAQVEKEDRKIAAQERLREARIQWKQSFLDTKKPNNPQITKTQQFGISGVSFHQPPNEKKSQTSPQSSTMKFASRKN